MKLKTFFLYFIYLIGVFIFFIYILFPQQKAGEILSSKINNEIFPDLKVNIEKVKPVLFFSVKIKNSEIILDNNSVINLDSITLSPSIISLFKKEKKIKFKIHAYKGTLKGVISAPYKNILSNLFLELDLDSFNFKNIKYKTKIGDINLGFIANAECKHQISSINDYGIGNGNINISECIAKINSDNFFIKQIEKEQFNFKKINIQYKIKKKRLELLKCSADSDKMKINVKGELLLKKSFKKSIINLKGELQIAPSFLSEFTNLSPVRILFKNSKLQGIPFNITGTIENPKIRVM
ncbi:MAG: type II secretion system protein GspN [Desulfobacteraceae bacterium 4572_130]|nr:MAG: type II secretion system protein GspN [Desulfobacteraceae bacterium 4572_130]